MARQCLETCELAKEAEVYLEDYGLPSARTVPLNIVSYKSYSYHTTSLSALLTQHRHPTWASPKKLTTRTVVVSTREIRKSLLVVHLALMED